MIAIDWLLKTYLLFLLAKEPNQQKACQQIQKETLISSKSVDSRLTIY